MAAILIISKVHTFILDSEIIYLQEAQLEHESSGRDFRKEAVAGTSRRTANRRGIKSEPQEEQPTENMEKKIKTFLNKIFGKKNENLKVARGVLLPGAPNPVT